MDAETVKMFKKMQEQINALQDKIIRLEESNKLEIEEGIAELADMITTTDKE